MDDAQFGIAITTTANTAGAEQVTQSLQDTAGAAKAMGTETAAAGGEATKGLQPVQGELKGVSLGFKSASLLGRSLGAVMAGDVQGGVSGAAFAVKGLNLAIRANPLGLLAAGVALVLPFLARLIGSSNDAAKALKDTDDKADGAGGKVKKLGTDSKDTTDIIDGLGRKIGEVPKALDEFEKAQAKSKAGLKALHDDFKSAAEEADHLATAEKNIVAAQLALALAKVTRDEFAGPDKGGITPEEAEAQRRKLTGKAKGDELDIADAATRAAPRAAGAIVGQKELEQQRAQAAVAAARKESADAIRAQEGLKKEQEAAGAAVARQAAGGPVSPEAGRRAEEADTAAAAGTERQAAAIRKLNQANDDLDGSTKNLSAAQDQLAAANKAAAAKLSATQTQRQINAQTQDNEEAKAGNEEAKKRTEAAQKSADEKAAIDSERRQHQQEEFKKSADKGIDAALDIFGDIEKGEKGAGTRDAKRQKEREKIDTEVSDVSKNARALARSPEERRKIEAATAKLDDGADEQELDGLANVLDGYLGAMTNKQSKQAVALQALINRVKLLEQQVRNSRDVSS